MKSALFVFCAVVILGVAFSVSAHPPSTTKVTFDLDSHMLTVMVEHGTRDAAKHYVDKIEVELNGDKVIEQKFNSQLDTKIQKAVYILADAKIGDEIKVAAHCNIAGKQKASIKVEKPATPEKPNKETKEAKDSE
jgi:desulfoferrodoxin (superoxide reductase-like protein)